MKFLSGFLVVVLLLAQIPDTIPGGGGGGGSGTVSSVATTSPITGGTITTTGTIACATCVTSAASLTSNAVVIGGGSQASSTISASTTTTQALFATAGAPAFRAIVAGDLPANNKIHSFGATFYNGGATLVAGNTFYATIPFSCTISAWNILVDQGTATLKVWKIATGTAIPTVSNSINTSGIAISSGTAIHSTTTSDFTSTTVSANDIVGINLLTVASATQIRLDVECDQ